MPDERVEALKRESVPQLLRELSLQTTTLVRQEIELAKTELREKTRAAAAGAALFGMAAVLGLAAFGAITTCIIAALASVMAVWAAALVVGVIYAIIALLAGLAGKRKIAQATPVSPQQAAQSIKDYVEWIKTRAH